VVASDPTGLSEHAVTLPAGIVPMLELCDGTRDVATLGVAFELRTGVRVGPEYLEKLIATLDEALLLDSERFARACTEALDRYRTAPSRLPSMIGTTYQENPQWLERMLRDYFDAAVAETAKPGALDAVRGLVSPHIDYQRGGLVYAQAWQRAAEAARETEVAVILGTNHRSGKQLFTLTRQSYSTPWGILPTSVDVVDAVASMLGEDSMFADELNHRNEHSVEAAAVWLHYLVRDRRCELVPILCGSFQEFMEGDGYPEGKDDIARFVDAVREATRDRRTLVVAAGDLAHVGPAFGDRYPMGVAERAEHSEADGELMATIAEGDPEGVFRRVKEEGDRRRICGLSPIYLALRLLGDTKGEITGYEQCPADPQGASFVSICGIALG
jgi:AmmeMemoRadiSam system protein B